MQLHQESEAVDSEIIEGQAVQGANRHENDTHLLAVPTAGATPSFSPYTVEEWRVPSTILSQLPPSIKCVNLDVELEGTEQDVEAHIRDRPKWAEIDRALADLPNLERVAIRRVVEQPPFYAQWTKREHDILLEKLPLIREKKLLQLHWCVCKC